MMTVYLYYVRGFCSLNRSQNKMTNAIRSALNYRRMSGLDVLGSKSTANVERISKCYQMISLSNNLR